MSFDIEIDIISEPQSQWLNDDALIARMEASGALPSPPGVAAKLIELGNDPAADLEDVASAVQSDVALGERILAISNTPRYARSREITNLRQALGLLGLSTTLNLALSASLLNSVKTKEKKGIDPTLFWRFALATAVCARVLGTREGATNGESFFLAGLLQDVGVLVLDQVMPDLYRNKSRLLSDPNALCQLERDALGYDHTVIGAWTLERWGLPELYQYTTNFSHAGELNHPNHTGIASTNRLAARFAGLFSTSMDKSATFLALESLQATMGLTAPGMARILGQIGEELVETMTLFELDLWRRDDLDAIVELSKEIQQDDDPSCNTPTDRRKDVSSPRRDESQRGLISPVHARQQLPKELKMADQGNWPIGVLRVQVGALKKLADNKGELVAEQFSGDLGRVALATFRDSDLVTQPRKSLLLAILPGTDEQGSERAKERLLEALDHGRLAQISELAKVTVSVVMYTPGVPEPHDKWLAKVFD